MALADGLRTGGIRTAILTNGIDTIPRELAESGIDEHFDAVFNSAEIGFAKPDERAFRHVLDTLGFHGREVFFTDDSPSKLVGAEVVGMVTHHFTDVEPLRLALRTAGVAILSR